MRKIYVCSALRGDIKKNIEKAKSYCEYVVKEYGFIPIAPHIYFTQFLDDRIAEEREFGLSAGLSLLMDCNELWYFGDEVTRGMTDEICYALKNGIEVKYIPIQKYEKYLPKNKKHNYQEVII